jgi:hypothetical protein
MDFFLSIINSIKIGDKMLENGIFKNYDTNLNSIWDKAEIRNLQKDISKFANEDGDSESLSETEFNNYQRDLLSKANNEQDKNFIEDFFNNIQVFKKCYRISYKNVLQLNSFKSQDLDEILRELEYFQITSSDDDENLQISSYKDGINYNYTFDKQGLFEYSTRENDEFAQEPFSKEFIKQYTENYSNNYKQEITFRRFDPKDSSKYDIVEMQTEHNGVTTKVIKQDNGYLKIEEINSNGEIRDLQNATYNKETKTFVLTKISTSPEGVKSEFKQEISDTAQRLTYRIIDSDGNILLDKSSSLIKIKNTPETYSYKVNEFNTTQNFELSILGNSIKIKNSDNGQEHTIELADYLENDNNMEFFMNILKRVPPNQLFLITPENLNQMKTYDFLYDGGCKPNNNKFDIQIGKYDNELSYFNVFMHEYGHFIDNVSNNISSNPELKTIYKAEFEHFTNNVTSEDKNILSHIANDFVYKDGEPLKECVAEANAILTAGIETGPNQLRLYYFQKYFPRTICKIEELIFNATKCN